MRAATQLLEALAAGVSWPLVRAARAFGGVKKEVVVVGWWGSETVGDVAILGQLLRECRAAGWTEGLSVVSFNPRVTRASLDELGEAEVRLVPVGFRSGVSLVAAQCVIFAGGPLMQSPSMKVGLIRAAVGRLSGARVFFYCCGIGPLRSWLGRVVVREMLRLGTHVALRDGKSATWFREALPGRDVSVFMDPAFDYGQAVRTIGPNTIGEHVALVLRTPAAVHWGRTDFHGLEERLLEAVAQGLNRLMMSRSIRLVGCAMDSGLEPSQDHSLYERLRSRLHDPTALYVQPGRHTVGHVLSVISSSKAALTVRFHGMIFALATGTPFVAIDYEHPPGKVTATAHDAGRLGCVLGLDNLRGSEIADSLRTALEGSDRPVPDSLGGRQALRVKLIADALH